MPITEADLGANLLSIDQSAEFLGVSRSTITRMIARRELDVIRLGSGRGVPKISKRSLLDHVNRKVVPADRPGRRKTA
jgi:excisionase family DNA binding protein